MTDAGHSRSLAELRSGDAGVFGGKSSSLGELLAAGIPVPPGFALSADAFRAFVDEAGLGRRIEEVTVALDPGDVDSVGAAAKAIGEELRSAPVPDSVRDEVRERYAQLARDSGEDEPAVAVRSSALGEDSQDATFAGQQETYLWVRSADGICDAARDCWVSLYSPQAISYRARMGSPGEHPAMGVTVQLMVDAEVSGVMFTCNPVSGDPSMVAVNASWGLGLAVVGGEVTPDDYLVSKITREIVKERLSSKQVEYVPGRTAAAPCGWRSRTSGATCPASTCSSSACWWMSLAGSSATSAPTRTSSGRSRAGSATSSWCSRGRSRRWARKPISRSSRRRLSNW